MSNQETTADAPPTRDELVTMVARAHHASAYGDATVAGRALAAQSKLPKLIAENLGAGFGQWDFFPEAAEIVDFALGYAPPATAEEMWKLARTWAADDAAGRHTLLALVGREIAQHELRRVEVPELRELFDEIRPARARALRTALGLETPPIAAPKPEPKRKAMASPTKRAAAAPAGAPSGASSPAASPAGSLTSSPAASPAGSPAASAMKAPAPARMPKPELKKPPPKAEAAPAKRFTHPKFGEGSLQAQDGDGPDAKLTIKFATGTKTLLARYVTEVAS